MLPFSCWVIFLYCEREQQELGLGSDLQTAFMSLIFCWLSSLVSVFGSVVEFRFQSSVIYTENERRVIPALGLKCQRVTASQAPGWRFHTWVKPGLMAGNGSCLRLPYWAFAWADCTYVCCKGTAYGRSCKEVGIFIAITSLSFLPVFRKEAACLHSVTLAPWRCAANSSNVLGELWAPPDLVSTSWATCQS